MGSHSASGNTSGQSPFLSVPLGQKTPDQLRPPRIAPTNYPWGDEQWPQAHGDSQSLGFHTPTFRAVAAKLRADLAQHKATAEHLRKVGMLQASDVGGWQAGQDLFATTKQTHASVLAVHEAFVTAYLDLIHKIEASAGVYDTAEDESAAAIRKLEGLLGGNDAPESPRPDTSKSRTTSEY